ncbi:hypothetical protein AMTR_s00024p00240360 [Amborella trichopoda]|uniref:Pentacotripeptide-repeat region of PRORP domain-containing protein n=1 Tax=Amborella trichopoda TaxID=13333 RepID=W1PVG7_AMBTC|nr:hypothetical protein AMTR_s00024p00240360 [Amborella trichopoda]
MTRQWIEESSQKLGHVQPKIFPGKSIRSSISRTFGTNNGSMVPMSFHDLAYRGSSPIFENGPPVRVSEVIPNPDAWLVKVLCTLCVRVGWCSSLESRLKHFSKALNPLVSFEVIKRLNDPKLSLRFFDYTNAELGFDHLIETYKYLIKILCHGGFPEKANEVYVGMRKSGHLPNNWVLGLLVSSYSEAGNFDGAMRVNHIDRACGVLKEIHPNNGFAPDVVSYTAVITGYCKAGNMEGAERLFAEMLDNGIKPNTVTFNVLIDGYGKLGNMGRAKSLFEQMSAQGCFIDVVTYTTLIDANCRGGLVDEALRLWGEMGFRKISPNEYTFSVIINALCKENRVSEAYALLLQLKCRNFVPEPFTYNPVIDGLCKAGNVEEANHIVEEMEAKGCEHDKFTYTILIVGHCMKGRVVEAIDLFHKMFDKRCFPDAITVNSLITLLLKAGMPNEASQIVAMVSENRLNLDLTSSSSRPIPCALKRMEIPAAA